MTCVSGLTYQAEPPPVSDVDCNRRGNGDWLGHNFLHIVRKFMGQASGKFKSPDFSPLGRTNELHIYPRDVHNCQTAFPADRPRATGLLLRKVC
jgi:hypothetical protein